MNRSLTLRSCILACTLLVVLASSAFGLASGLKPINPFDRVLPLLRRTTLVPILLPAHVPRRWLPGPVYAVIMYDKASSYSIQISGLKDCRADACDLGSVSGALLFKASPRLSGKPVRLRNGTIAFFHPFTCGAPCGESWIAWDIGGARYTVGIKAGDLQETLELANSLRSY